jgi:hypothetical protein
MLTNHKAALAYFRIEHPSWVLAYADQIFAWLERVCRHKVVMCLLFAAVTMGARIALLRRIPIPQPYVSDEFSYLLGGETFASGRLTNPTHPMWVHFETFHELMRPTYMSKYPPGQALFLALGWRLLGHPWFGVLISYGVFAACLCWMLQNWVPPIYAALATAITLAQISIFGYWMNSYWGGAVAASAGCLLLGVLPRLARRVKSKDVVLAALGLVILANTRPYEGLVMSAAALVALLSWRARRQKSSLELLSPRCLLPLLLVCGTGALLDGYYNYRVTGNVFQPPYVAYAREYDTISPWIILPARQLPNYRHPAIRNTFQRAAGWVQDRKDSLRLRLDDLYSVVRFYCPPLYAFPVALAILLTCSYRLRTAAVLLLCVWSGFFVENYILSPHYLAGSVGLLPVLAAYGFRWLRVINRGYGPVIALTLATLLCMQVVLGGAEERGQPWQTRRAPSPRMIALSEATKQGGRHLILVRYSPDHLGGGDDECVYNSADIDASQIVWARDMGEAKNRELIDYYRGSRKIWLYLPETDPAKLIAYEPASH